MMKKFLGVLLVLCLVMGLAPVSALAADGEKAIQLGTTAIDDPVPTTNDSGTYYTPASYVYFGSNSGTPIKWRVLDADKSNAGSDGMFLLSEYLLASGIQFEAASNNDGDGQTNPNEWQNSDVQTWCANHFDSYFLDGEKRAVLSTDKTDLTAQLYNIDWGTSTLSAEKDKLFFLSAQELADYVGNYNLAHGLSAKDGENGSTGMWWLRSPSVNFNNSDLSGVVAGNGAVYLSGVTYDRSARPAFNLDLSKVLFTAAASGGKPEGFTIISDYTGNEWKLTLLDKNRNFYVYQKAVTAMAGNTITLSYNGATVGNSEYISVILMDANDELLYYGRVAQPAEDGGTVDIAIPGDLPEGSYTLKVFNEQYNGDYQTDYASAFCDVALTIDNTPPSIGYETAVRTGAATATMTFTSSEAGTYWYAVAEPDADAPTIDRTGSGYPCVAGTNTISLTGLSNLGAKALYYVVADHAGNLSGPFLCDIASYTPVVTVTTDDNGTVLDTGVQDDGYACVVVQAGIGYELDNVTVKDANGDCYEYEIRMNGEQILFQMPDCDVTVQLTFKPCTVVYFDSNSSNWEHVWARVFDEQGNNIALSTSQKDHRGYFALNVPAGYTKILFQNVAFGAPYEPKNTPQMEIVPNRVYAYLIQSPTKDQTITVYEGDKATMAIETKDGLTCQWQINYNDGTGWHNCGENSPVYTSSPTKLNNSGYRYRCQVTNVTGAVCTSHTFTLEVLEKIELPETGDSSTPLLWLTMSMLSLLGIVLLRRKCEQ